jgi:hypothetical protein
MERPPLFHQPLSKGHPAETRTPSLLDRLKKQGKAKSTKVPLLERLSDRLKPSLKRSGQGKQISRNLSLKLVKSLPQNQKETNNSSQTLSNDIPPPSTESRPLLLNRIDMGPSSPSQSSARVNERVDLAMEVDDMRNLTGIMSETPNKPTSTTSLIGYPRERDLSWEERTRMESPSLLTATQDQEMNIGIWDDQTKSKGSTSRKCHGLAQNDESGDRTQTVVATKLETRSTSSKEIPLLSKNGLDVPPVPQQDFRAQNGTHSSKVRQLTSIPSSVLSTTSIALTKASDVLALLRSSLEDRSPPRKLKRVASGPLHSTLSSKQPRLSSPTVMMNSNSMENISRSCFQLNKSPSTQDYSNMTKRSDTRSDKDRISYSPTEENSPVITKPLSHQMASDLKEQVKEIREVRERAENLEKSLASAIASMEQRDAALQLTNANTNTFARSASNLDMDRGNVKSRRQCEELGRLPRYLRHNIYRSDERFTRSCAEWTESARPFASVPVSEFTNQLAIDTINRHPDLFQISTPINVDKIEDLLTRHPNPPFVKSVVDGFRNGFWPWADTNIGIYPDTLDESLGDPKNQTELDFVCEQRDKEIKMGRFSDSFGTELLPGMYSMPIHVVPKPHSTDFRLVTNHSAGEFSLNSMIKREDIAGYPLDNMTQLGEMLLKNKADFPDEEFVLFKSDISEAYRNLPMHPLWQIKQINTIKGQRYVEHRNCFGGKGSGSLFIGFNALVTWIGKFEYEIANLLSYSDDSFGVERAQNLTYYEPYNRSLPTNQAKLLSLWDDIGVPHKEKKQISGSTLTIIGIEVDANNLTLTLPSEKKSELVDHLNDFARTPVYGNRDGPAYFFD